jgi:polysaccharide biosynthesis protein PslH
MRILFLSPYLPSRVRIRPFSWIQALHGLGHEIHLVAVRPPEDAWGDEAELRTACQTVEIVPLSRSRTLLNGLRTLATRKPLQLAYARSPTAEDRAGQIAKSGRFDVVHVEHLRGVRMAARVGDLPRVWDAVDCISSLFAETAVNAPGPAQRAMARLDLTRTRRFEAWAPRQFDATLVTSQADADAFQRLSGGGVDNRVTVLPNGVDTTYFAAATGTRREAVIFTGKLSYHANAAAALRLVRRIMPLVWAAHPGTPVVLAGKDPPDALKALAADPRVTVTGFVPDMRPTFSQALVAACPLVYGAGIQNKILEAMASGVPVVTTPSAAAALQATAGRECRIGGDDQAFAAEISMLLDDRAQATAVGLAGRAYVERAHQWPRLAERLTEVYAQACRTAATRGPRHRAPSSPRHALRG